MGNCGQTTMDYMYTSPKGSGGCWFKFDSSHCCNVRVLVALSREFMAIPLQRRHPSLRGVIALIVAFPFLALCQPQNTGLTPGRADLSTMLAGSTTVFGDTVDINAPLYIENKLVAKLDDSPFYNPNPVTLEGNVYGSITVVAEQIRLNQAVKFDLSGQTVGDWRDGGDVVIVAHKLIVDGDGQPRIDARGADGYVGDFSACIDYTK